MNDVYLDEEDQEVVLCQLCAANRRMDGMFLIFVDQAGLYEECESCGNV